MNSLDAETAGCSTLVESLEMGAQLSGCPSVVVSLLLMHVAFFVDCSARGLVVTELHSPALTCGCPVARVCVALWSGWYVAECRMSSPSNDIEHAVEMEQGWMDRGGKRYGLYNTQMTWCSYALQQKYWNKGSKLWIVRRTFLLLGAERAVCYSGDFVSTPFDAHEFMRWFRQESFFLFRDFQFARDS